MTTSIKCVVDTSVCIKQFISDSLSAKAQQLFAYLANSSNQIYVPDLLYIESANVFWKYVRAGQLTASQVQGNLSNLKALSLQVVSMADLMEEAANIAIAYGISAYDASYVALSHRVSAPLLTLDRKLVNTLAIAPYNLELFTNFSVPPLS